MSTLSKQQAPFHTVRSGKCIEINSSHLPEEDFEELLDLVNRDTIRFRGSFIDYFFLIDDYLDMPGSFGVRLQYIPWSDEKLQENIKANISEMKQALFDESLPSSFIDLLFHVGEAGYEILIIDPHAQVVDGLRTFEG